MAYDDVFGVFVKIKISEWESGMSKKSFFFKTKSKQAWITHLKKVFHSSYLAKQVVKSFTTHDTNVWIWSKTRGEI